MKEVKPMKTWEKIVTAALIGTGFLMFADTGRAEALFIAMALLMMWYIRIWAMKKQIAGSHEE